MTGQVRLCQVDFNSYKHKMEIMLSKNGLYYELLQAIGYNLTTFSEPPPPHTITQIVKYLKSKVLLEYPDFSPAKCIYSKYIFSFFHT